MTRHAGSSAGVPRLSRLDWGIAIRRLIKHHCRMALFGNFFRGHRFPYDVQSRGVSGPAEHYPNKWKDGGQGAFGGDSARYG